MHALIKVDSVEVCGDDVRAALHSRFVRRKQQQGAMDAEEARDLLAAMRVRVWEYAGCATFVEYLERYTGLGAHAAYDRVRVASALNELPLIEAELEAGELTYSHVRELVRIVVPETEQAWVDHTRGMTVKQVGAELSGHEKGDLPDDDKDPDLHLKNLSMKVRPSTAARFWDLVRGLEKERGDKFVDDEDQLQAVCDALQAARAQDAGEEPTTITSGPQIWLTPDGDAYAYGSRLFPDEIETAECCGHVMGHTHESNSTWRKRKKNTKKKARIKARDGHKCVVPGCNSRRYLDVHHITRLADGGSDADANLCTLCSGHHRLLHRGLIQIVGPAPDLTIHRVTPNERRRSAVCPRPSMAPWAC